MTFHDSFQFSMTLSIGSNSKLFLITVRASDRSQKKVKFCGIFTDRFAEKLADFAKVSRKFSGLASLKNSW